VPLLLLFLLAGYHSVPALVTGWTVNSINTDRHHTAVKSLLWAASPIFDPTNSLTNRSSFLAAGGGGGPNYRYRKSYMIALKIPEQLTMCTIHFHQFLNIVNDWNLTSVEPFIYFSDMFGLRSLVPYASVAYNFGRLFNVTLHNDHLSRCMNRTIDPEIGKPVLFDPMGKFLNHSHRELVVIHFMWYWNTLKNRDWRLPLERSLENRTETAFLDCTEESREHGLAAEVERAFHNEIRIEGIQFPDSVPEFVDDFKVVQTFCIKKRVKISLRDLRDYIFNNTRNRDRVSYVFLHFQGRWTQPLVSTDVDYINKCRLSLSQTFHSNAVIEASERFRQSLGFTGQPYLSIHMRFEKMYLYAQQKHYPLEKYMNCCMTRLNHLLRKVRAKYDIPINRTLLIWDYSPYGTSVCPLNNCKRETAAYMNQIDATGTFLDPKKFDLPPHHGVIALAESRALYNGKALVTVGSGSYQSTIVDTFIERHSKQFPGNPEAAKELHYGHLCIPPEELHGLTLPPEPDCKFG
jgi:hypothetical protein